MNRTRRRVSAAVNPVSANWLTFYQSIDIFTLRQMPVWLAGPTVRPDRG
jgi:hypothetical protein